MEKLFTVFVSIAGRDLMKSLGFSGLMDPDVEYDRYLVQEREYYALTGVLTHAKIPYFRPAAD